MAATKKRMNVDKIENSYRFLLFIASVVFLVEYESPQHTGTDNLVIHS